MRGIPISKYRGTISDTVTVGTETIQLVDVVRNLGVWIDRELSMKQHVIKVAAVPVFTSSDIYDKFGDVSTVRSPRGWSWRW